MAIYARANILMLLFLLLNHLGLTWYLEPVLCVVVVGVADGKRHLRLVQFQMARVFFRVREM